MDIGHLELWSIQWSLAQLIAHAIARVKLNVCLRHYIQGVFKNKNALIIPCTVPIPTIIIIRASIKRGGCYVIGKGRV